MKKKKLLTDRSNDTYQEIIDRHTKAMREEIDARVLQSMFVEMGWHEVILSPMTAETGQEIDSWVRQHVKRQSYWTHGLVWLFKNDQDAMWFKLRWL